MDPTAESDSDIRGEFVQVAIARIAGASEERYQAKSSSTQSRASCEKKALPEDAVATLRGREAEWKEREATASAASSGPPV